MIIKELMQKLSFLIILSCLLLSTVKVTAEECYVYAYQNVCSSTVDVEGECNGTTSFKTQESCKSHRSSCATVTCSNSGSTFEGNTSCPDATGNCDAGHPRARPIPVGCWNGNTYTTRNVTVCFDQTAVVTEDDAFGEVEMPWDSTGAVDNKTLDGLGDFINKIINFLLFAAAVLLLINIVLAGIKIITGGQDPKNFSAAMKRILYSALGIVVVALAYVITGWVSQLLFGSPEMLLNPTIGSS